MTEWDREGWDKLRRERYGVRAFPETHWMQHARVGTCKWCGKSVPRPAIYWHKDCKEQYFLHTRLEYQFDYLAAEFGEKCAMVGCGAAPMKWTPGPVYCITAGHCMGNAEFKAEFERTHWPRPDKPWHEWTEEDRQIGAQQEIGYRSSALEVDHRIPLWEVAHLPDEERRWYFGPENLWLLCPPCHKAKSRREAAQRAHERRMVTAQLLAFDDSATGV